MWEQADEGKFMADETEYNLNKIDPKILKKISSDLAEIKGQLSDLENIKHRLTTLEQLQMKILSGEVQIGPQWQNRPSTNEPEPEEPESEEDLEFEVVGFSSDSGEETFKFTGEQDDEEVFVAVAPYEYNEIEDLPELVNVEQPSSKDDDFDDLEYGCPYCGTTVSAFSTMCPNCGREIEEEEDIAQREQATPPTQHNALEQYYRAQHSGKYEDKSQEPVKTADGDSPYSKYRALKNSVEVQPMHEPPKTPEAQLSSYASHRASEQPPDCSSCFKPLTYIEKYGRWYCYDCKKYSKPQSTSPDAARSAEPQEPHRGGTRKKFPLKDYPGYRK
jgi:protein-arginine kinase activator protein McsA